MGNYTRHYCTADAPEWGEGHLIYDSTGGIRSTKLLFRNRDRQIFQQTTAPRTIPA